MQKALLAFAAASTLVLGGGIATSQAQQGSTGPMMQQQGDGPDQRRSRSEEGRPGMTGRGDGHGMADMRGRQGRDSGRMGPGMMVMMMIMMDTNGDRALSLEEVQAVHARVFNYADADGDGQLTLEEMQQFLRGGGFVSGR